MTLLGVVTGEPGSAIPPSARENQKRFQIVHTLPARRGGYLWSPKRNASGARNEFYENMREVSPGISFFLMTPLFLLACEADPQKEFVRTFET